MRRLIVLLAVIITGTGIIGSNSAAATLQLGATIINDQATTSQRPAQRVALQRTVTAPQHVLFISDSSFAGIRWGGAFSELQGNHIDAKLESCRRLAVTSCRGREGYAPRSALEELRQSGNHYDTLIIGTGYNDSANAFSGALEQIVTLARQKGINHIGWFNYRTQTTYVSPGARSAQQTFVSHNQHLETAVNSGHYPELYIIDWNGYSHDRFDWVYPDGVHFRPAGGVAAAQYLSNALAAHYQQPCPHPISDNTIYGCTRPAA